MNITRVWALALTGRDVPRRGCRPPMRLGGKIRGRLLTSRAAARGLCLSACLSHSLCLTLFLSFFLSFFLSRSRSLSLAPRSFLCAIPTFRIIELGSFRLKTCLHPACIQAEFFLIAVRVLKCARRRGSQHTLQQVPVQAPRSGNDGWSMKPVLARKLCISSASSTHTVAVSPLPVHQSAYPLQKLGTPSSHLTFQFLRHLKAIPTSELQLLNGEIPEPTP